MYRVVEIYSQDVMTPIHANPFALGLLTAFYLCTIVCKVQRYVTAVHPLSVALLYKRF
jgi:hypothetical protein